MTLPDCCVSLEVLLTSRFLHRIIQIHPVRWPSGLRRQLKVIPFVVHQQPLVRKGVGSNPTLINISFAFCLGLTWDGYASRRRRPPVKQIFVQIDHKSGSFLPNFSNGMSQVVKVHILFMSCIRFLVLPVALSACIFSIDHPLVSILKSSKVTSIPAFSSPSSGVGLAP